MSTPTTGAVEIGFVDSPSSGYQAISLNIVSVRLNPSTNPNVADSDANWKVITAPPGSNIATGGTLNVNLLDFQTNATVFNTARIVAQDYHQIEVVVDATFPGSVIPSCSSGTSPAFEGCVNYPLTFTVSTNLRTSGSVNVTPTGLTTLIIDIDPGTLTPPSAPGGNYTATPMISVQPPGNYLTNVIGTVAGGSKNDTSVTAEITGTNSVIATAPVSSTGTYTIALPAAATLGTTYDVFAGGTTTDNVFTGSVTFDAVSGVTVMRGGAPVTENFSVTASPAIGTVSGSIISSGTGTTGAIPGATVNLLRPSDPSTDCATTLGAGCVVVATTASDSSGTYAMTSIPIGKYFVEAQATGTNTVIQPLTLSTSGSLCTGSQDASNCSFTLPTAVIQGTVNVTPPASVSSSTSVIILAEQHGTGNLVGVTEVTARSLSTPFSIQVPTKIGTVVPPDLTFDLIATAQDTYLGIGSAFTGHNQAVLADIAGGATGLEMTVDCLGHGTISGTVANPDSGSQVVLFQNAGTIPSPVYVQLQNSTVGQTDSAFPGQFSFCAPPGDDYYVQRFQQTSPTSSPSAVLTPQGPITVFTPAPAVSTSPTPGPVATPTPCPVCMNSATPGQCPGNCRATTLSNPL